ncbi:MAG: ASPIC/UnbV domain-containing protein, partial [Rubripirellula sp.]
IDLYVANDMTGNHFWSSGQTDSSFGLLQLAAVRGLGSSGRSRSQASMGMAAGDPDGDGDIDFFLTHFTDDHNTYYEQVSPGLWVDRSYQVGLAAPSLKFLGFGTEWVDFDNNGTLELIVVNGHVDDVDQSDVAYRMPPQLFRRTGNGEWEELERGQLGPYFTNEHLGRALASVDADRDGRVDVAITHLYQPVSLLINDTDDCGQSISLQLKATRTSRDGIGATVQASVAGRKVTAQLLAGDGYMCSNERRITIGCGNNKMIDGLTVTWASGQTESFGTLDVGHEYLLVQGSGEVYRLPKEP